jgi:NADPH:quinone reductase-like Zn-dependent oxidoreductase
LGDLHAGNVVLTMGSGGVATWALQLAKQSGAKVVATTRSTERADALRTLGADHIVNRIDVPEWGRPIRKWAGEGVDVVVDVGGAGTLPQSLEAVRLGGRVALIGVLAGVESTLNILPVLMKQVRVQGVFVGPRTSLESLSAYVAQHRVRPWVGQILEVEQAADALKHLADGEHQGHTCLAWPGADTSCTDGPPHFVSHGST